MRRIPVLLSRDEANALVDVWESLQHGYQPAPARASSAFHTIEWIRNSIGDVGRAPQRGFWSLVRLEFTILRINVRQAWLRWRYKHHSHVLLLTPRERTALMRLLVTHKSDPELRTVIERLKAGDARAGTE